MRQSRKEELSIYYFIKDLFPTFVTIRDDFPEDELILPTVAVLKLKKRAKPFQLGGDDLNRDRWSIYVYGQNKGQRDDYLDLIHNSIEHGIRVYNYDEGFPPSASPSQIGSLVVESRESEPLRVYAELVKKKYWWGVVTFQTYFNATS